MNVFPTWKCHAANAIYFVIAAVLMSPLVASAQLKVIISGGFSGPYEQLLPEFERTTAIKVTTGSGASQGTGPQTIAAQLARGVPVDVVILSREGLAELIAVQRISTVDAFKQAVLKANAVAVPSSTSGIFLMNDVFPRLGIADKVKVKPTARGTGATAMVASGEADIAVMPVSEIVHALGVELAGTIAQEIQLNQVFAAAVVAGSKEVEAAKRLIAFLASDRASAAISRGGMEPLGKRH